ncbi:hypothetical protein HK097_003748 [Rhizophlyctis rosea]|uniref:C2H2-type domain-containing protein n=1 Tax=Rhizophlyctis rosea TaxID=64517 RepID=A0AAD5WZW2_9FUNG|nr:hypothetical protein HK097_003748 [Rhizophlyctis rosea]
MATLIPPSFQQAVPAMDSAYARDDSVLYGSSSAPYQRRPSLPHNFQYTPPASGSLQPPQTIMTSQTPMMAQPIFYHTPPTPNSTSPMLQPYIPQRPVSPMLTDHTGKYMMRSPSLMPISPALTAVDPLGLSPVIPPAVEPSSVLDDPFSLDPSLAFGDGSGSVLSGSQGSGSMDLDLEDLASVLNLDPEWNLLDGEGGLEGGAPATTNATSGRGIFDTEPPKATPAGPTQGYYTQPPSVYGPYASSPTFNAANGQIPASSPPRLMHPTTTAQNTTQLVIPYGNIPMQVCTCPDPRYVNDSCEECRPPSQGMMLRGAPVLGVSPTVIPNDGRDYAVEDGWMLDRSVTTAPPSAYTTTTTIIKPEQQQHTTLAVPGQVPSVVVYPPTGSRATSPLPNAMLPTTVIAPAMQYVNVPMQTVSAPYPSSIPYVSAPMSIYQPPAPANSIPMAGSSSSVSSKDASNSPPSSSTSTSTKSVGERKEKDGKGGDGVGANKAKGPQQQQDEAQHSFRCACGKGFPKLSSLKTHARLHGRERNFICDICKKVCTCLRPILKLFKQ